jgi:CheY-like chemotaxis protein
MLPEMNGITLAERLKAQGFQSPKIAMSASHKWIQESKRSNLFEATLDKPFDIEELLTCIEQYLL